MSHTLRFSHARNAEKLNLLSKTVLNLYFMSKDFNCVKMYVSIKVCVLFLFFFFLRIGEKANKSKRIKSLKHLNSNLKKNCVICFGI